MLNENNAVLATATQKVYRCLGKLIKICDEIMLNEETEECPSSMSSENVQEIVDVLEDAIRVSFILEINFNISKQQKILNSQFK